MTNRDTMHAEVIAIGDEITSGQLLDTNSQWLSQRLEELGIRVLFHTTVGDELEPCVAVFRQAIDRADLIVVTGGLGPTADDLTREALARATDRELRLDSDALEHICAMFAQRRWPMPPQNRLQAMFPAGSQVVRNPHGTAPGIDLEVPRDDRTPCRVLCLPGVPAEVFDMWSDSVGATIQRFVGSARRVIRRRQIHCFGAGEGRVESMLPDMIRRGRQPTVGITASKATISLRIAAEGQTEEECFAAIEPTVATIRQCLGTLVFGEGDDQLQHAVVRLLGECKQTLATAECATAGLLAEWLAGIGCAKPDSISASQPAMAGPQTRSDLQDVYRGGLVLTEAIESVEAMAIRCREEFGADFGIAVGPFPTEASVGSDAADSTGSGAVPAESTAVPLNGRAGLNTESASGGQRSVGAETGAEGDGPKTVAIVLASADGVGRKAVPLGIHPALWRIYIAKQALNFVRLALLGKTTR